MTTSTDDPGRYLTSGVFIDSDSPQVREYAERAVGAATDRRSQAAHLFRAVRDGLAYDPYRISTEPQDYRASALTTAERSWCVPKAVLLTAVARATGIPARIGFADVRNHLQTERLRQRMGGADLFVFHGYTEMWLEGRWVKATPAFNAALCARFGVAPLEFDGATDARLHAHSGDGSRYMEYVHDRGTYADLPLDDVLAGLLAHYGTQLMSSPEHDEPFHGGR
jgi:transglutaminase-like putative cysteine protease